LHNAKKLALKIKCAYTNDLSQLLKGEFLYVICIKDEAIVEFAKKLKLKSGILVHTSGSIAAHSLKTACTNYGVIYPLQTLSANKKTRFSKVPICIEASNAKSLEIIKNYALLLSKEIYVFNSSQRKKIHLAAVIINNFTNHLYALAHNYIVKEKLPTTLFHALMLETAKKAIALGPEKAQTGPARRNDKKVILEHTQMLETNKELQKIYTLLSKSISKQHRSNE
jgi:predicted short-subunit dehydrogenase-like oxidoreductase (DUF2520 family)